MPFPVWNDHRLPPPVPGRSGLRPSWAGVRRNLGQGLRGSSGTSYGLRAAAMRCARGRPRMRSRPGTASQAGAARRASSRTRPVTPGQSVHVARSRVALRVALIRAATGGQTGSIATVPFASTRIFGTFVVPTGTLPANAKRPSGQGAGRGRRASAGVTKANASTSAARRQRARRVSERIGWDVPARRGGRQREPIVVAMARRMAVARAAAHGTPQWVAVPREVVLMLPPSPEPPATAGAPLLAAVANALGCAPEALAEVRLRRLSFDARPRARCWRLVVDAWTPDEPPPAPIIVAPPTFSRPAPGAPRVVVVGSGPAGLFCALDCLAAGLNVTLLERGADVQTRRHGLAAANRGLTIDPDSNYCFGEGGAGTYSDGKLYARAGSRSAVRGVLEVLVAHGAASEILASWR